MEHHQLSFTIFVINKYALATHQTVTEVYKQFNGLRILDDYIIKHYEVLHTFGEQYLIEDLAELVAQKQMQQ